MHSWKYKKLKDEQRKARRKRRGHSPRHCYYHSLSGRNKKLIKKKIKAKKERNKFLEKVRQTFRRKIFRRKI